jgi:hypothetical protein
MLNTLLRLECLVLVRFVIVYFYLCLFNYVNTLFLVLSVFDRHLGISILVAIILVFGNDYFQSHRVLQC